MTTSTAPPAAAEQAHTRRVAERTRSARLIRDSIGLLSSKWAVDVLLALGDGTRRYHELLEDLSPISEKVLTQTLRAMERDGLLLRRVHAEVPPRVEYALSSLGATMAPPLKALGSWSLTHGKRVEEARERFDARAARASNRSRASSTCRPCASDHEPSAFSGGAIEAPSDVSAYSTRGGTSACTRRATSPSRSIARSVWVSTFSEIGERSSSSSW